MCPFELCDHAFVTCLSICLGIPVPHARILRTQPAYSTIDPWADFLLNDSARASRSQHASHDKLAYLLAKLASRAGVYSSAAQSAVPRAEADTFRHGDIVTFVGGLCSRSASYRFSSQTLLVTDVILTHPFDRFHTFKSDSLGAAERLKHHLYCSDYLDQGIAFAPLAFNSFGQHGPEALCYQWIIAGKLAQRICPVPTFDLPNSAATHGQEVTHSKRLASFQRLRSKLFRQSVQEITTAVFEAVCKRFFGRTLALQTCPCLSLLLSPALSSLAFSPPPSCLCCSTSSPPSSSSLFACFLLSFPSSFPSCRFPPNTLLTFTSLSHFTSSSFFSLCPGLQSS
jgi:hypothetical protein